MSASQGTGSRRMAVGIPSISAREAGPRWHCLQLLGTGERRSSIRRSHRKSTRPRPSGLRVSQTPTTTKMTSTSTPTAQFRSRQQHRVCSPVALLVQGRRQRTPQRPTSGRTSIGSSVVQLRQRSSHRHRNGETSPRNLPHREPPHLRVASRTSQHRHRRHRVQCRLGGRLAGTPAHSHRRPQGTRATSDGCSARLASGSKKRSKNRRRQEMTANDQH